MLTSLHYSLVESIKIHVKTDCKYGLLGDGFQNHLLHSLDWGDLQHWLSDFDLPFIPTRQLPNHSKDLFVDSLDEPCTIHH